jgi:hypothetical protein
MSKPKRNIVRKRIAWRWKWSQAAYHYMGFYGHIVILPGLIFFLNGWVITGVVISFSTIVLRRLLYWIEVFFVEPSCLSRILKVIHLSHLIKPGKYTIKKFLLCGLLITAIELLASWQFDFQTGALWGTNFWLFGILLLAIMTEFGPPFVIFLGSSDRSQELLPKIIAGCIPHRVMSPLNIESWAIDKWRARANDPEKWREMVRSLARISCIIVLDSRFLTPAVKEECEWILNEGLDYKMVIVSNNGGKCPVLDTSISRIKKTKSAENVLIVTPDALFSVVKILTAGRQFLPSKNKSAALILRKHGFIS